MHDSRSTILLFGAVLIISFVLADIAFAQSSSANISRVESPEPFYAVYNVAEYSPQQPPPSDEVVAKNVMKLRRELSAKGHSSEYIDRVAKQMEEAFRMPTGGHRNIIEHFAASGKSTLHTFMEDDVLVRNTIKTDRLLSWNKTRSYKNKDYPIIEISNISAENPPQRANFGQEPVIFGFEPPESLFTGADKPKVTKEPDGSTKLSFSKSNGYPYPERQVVILDKGGRITSITHESAGKTENRQVETWTASNYVKANKGWIPKTISRKFSKGKTLINNIDLSLTKLETNPSAVNEWFGNKVPEPSFVEDSRFCEVTVKYFTKDKFLPDEEVKRRASMIAANRDQKVWKQPESPLRIAGIVLITLGIAISVWKLGWPKKLANDIDETPSEPE